MLRKDSRLQEKMHEYEDQLLKIFSSTEVQELSTIRQKQLNRLSQLPESPEQKQKIINFLEALDESIALLKKLKSLEAAQFPETLIQPDQAEMAEALTIIEHNWPKYYSTYKKLAYTLLSEKEIKPSPITGSELDIKKASDIALLSDTLKQDLAITQSKTPNVIACNKLARNVKEMERRHLAIWKQVLAVTCFFIVVALAGAFGGPLAAVMVGVGALCLGVCHSADDILGSKKMRDEKKMKEAGKKKDVEALVDGLKILIDEVNKAAAKAEKKETLKATPPPPSAKLWK